MSNQLSVAYNETKTILCFGFTMYQLKLFYQMNYFEIVYDKPLNSCIIIINIYRRCFDDCVHVVLIVVLDRQDKIDAYWRVIWFEKKHDHKWWTRYVQRHTLYYEMIFMMSVNCTWKISKRLLQSCLDVITIKCGCGQFLWKCTFEFGY